MTTIKFNDLFEKFSIDKNQYNVFSIKEIINAMIKTNDNAYIDNKQMIVFEEKLLKFLWQIHINWYDIFDINYNKKTDLSVFYQNIILAIQNDKQLNLLALFCPGYTENGYKCYLGHTSLWKLEKLQEIYKLLQNFGIKNKIICFYSDVFLENFDYEKNPEWEKELNYNKFSFHQECEKHSDLLALNLSDLKLFSKKDDIIGYIDNKVISNMSSKTYKIFKKANEKFYERMLFSNEQIEFRNNRLITMYTLFSDYINNIDNSVFLPMEDMYNRQIIFAKNKTCTMYLKLKKE